MSQAVFILDKDKVYQISIEYISLSSSLALLIKQVSMALQLIPASIMIRIFCTPIFVIIVWWFTPSIVNNINVSCALYLDKQLCTLCLNPLNVPLTCTCCFFLQHSFLGVTIRVHDLQIDIMPLTCNTLRTKSGADWVAINLFFTLQFFTMPPMSILFQNSI